MSRKFIEDGEWICKLFGVSSKGKLVLNGDKLEVTFKYKFKELNSNYILIEEALRDRIHFNYLRAYGDFLGFTVPIP